MKIAKIHFCFLSVYLTGFSSVLTNIFLFFLLLFLIPKIKKDLITNGILTEVKITGEASKIYVNMPNNLYDGVSK